MARNSASAQHEICTEIGDQDRVAAMCTPRIRQAGHDLVLSAIAIFASIRWRGIGEAEFSVVCFCCAIFSDNGSCRCRNWSCTPPVCELSRKLHNHRDIVYNLAIALPLPNGSRRKGQRASAEQQTFS
jgi:hypothetical protein